MRLATWWNGSRTNCSQRVAALNPPQRQHRTPLLTLTRTEWFAELCRRSPERHRGRWLRPWTRRSEASRVNCEVIGQRAARTHRQFEAHDRHPDDASPPVTITILTSMALNRVYTSTKEYVLVHNVKLVHNTEIRLVTKIVSNIVPTHRQTIVKQRFLYIFYYFFILLYYYFLFYCYYFITIFLPQTLMKLFIVCVMIGVRTFAFLTFIFLCFYVLCVRFYDNNNIANRERRSNIPGSRSECRSPLKSNRLFLVPTPTSPKNFVNIHQHFE